METSQEVVIMVFVPWGMKLGTSPSEAIAGEGMANLRATIRLSEDAESAVSAVAAEGDVVESRPTCTQGTGSQK